MFLASSQAPLIQHSQPTQLTQCPPGNIHRIYAHMARRRRPPRPGALTELPPLKILSQIVLLQVIWYAVATALILFTALVAGKHFSFDLVLSWRSLRGDTTVGWMLGLVWLLNSFIGFVLLLPSPLVHLPFPSPGLESEGLLADWKLIGILTAGSYRYSSSSPAPNSSPTSLLPSTSSTSS